MNPTTYRDGCGTYMGLRLHQVAGENPCARCLHGEAVRLLSLEGIPRRPSRPPVPDLLTVSPERARANRLALAQALAETDAYTNTTAP